MRGYSVLAVNQLQSLKATVVRLVIVVALIPCSFVLANAGTLRTFSRADLVGQASGIGSSSAVLLRDGTICATAAVDLPQCTALVKIPAKVTEIVRDGYGRFDGLFDLLGDGVPQVFVDYWPASSDPNCPHDSIESGERCNAIALLVYRYSGNSYRPYLTLHVVSFGYSPGAWFLDESPRKAIFQARCLGSTGSCLYYLDWRKRALEQIDGTASLQGPPVFEYLNHNPSATIFVTDRGYDRNAAQGAALIHWTRDA
jgi:hypothetical protein